MLRISSLLLFALGLAPVAPAEGPQAIPGKGTATAVTGTPVAPGGPGAPLAPVKPYRTFIHLQRFSIENNGEPGNPVSNVRLLVEFPNGNKFEVPGGSQYWPIGNGQVQEIDKVYELPFASIQNDGFKFVIQIERKGSKYLPCNFEVAQLSQFNRSYVCHTDIGWQQSQNIPEDQIDKQGVQVRVFTDLNSEPKEIPQSAMALR